MSESRKKQKQNQGLTKAETKTVLLASRGLTNKEIAAARVVSINTVRSLLRTAMLKTRTTNRMSLVVWAAERGLVTVGPKKAVGR